MLPHRKPCGLHCIKVNHLGVELEGQVILEDINLHIHCGKLNVIIGKNGAGKSTLVKAILGEIPHTGTIEFSVQGEAGAGRLRRTEAPRKMKIGYVPQKVNLDRDAPVSVYDMIASYHCSFPVFLGRRKADRTRVREHLRAFEAEELMDRPVGRLSGGELQRVLLTMAVMDLPNLLVMDEPVAGIDRGGMELFYRNIDRLKKHYDMAVILISHDLEYVARYADEVILLDTRVLARGSAAAVYESPAFREVFGLPVGAEGRGREKGELDEDTACGSGCAKGEPAEDAACGSGEEGTPCS